METWHDGQKLKYHKGHGHVAEFCEAHAGLYWYSGFGCGTFLRPDHTTLWCSPSEAQAEAKRLGVTYRYVDSFVPSTFGSVMG